MVIFIILKLLNLYLDELKNNNSLKESSAFDKLRSFYSTCIDYHEPKDENDTTAGLDDLYNYVNNLTWVKILKLIYLINC